MKLLLIGSRGCFGSEFKKISEKYNKIKFFFPTSKELNLCHYEKLKKYISKKKPNIIINAASIVGINQCEDEYSKAFKLNSASVLNLAKICEINKIILAQTSTHAVFEGKKKTQYNENDLPKSNNVYSASKLIAEHFVQTICTKHYVFRFPTMYGERRNNLLGFVDKVIINLKKDKPLFIAKDKLDSPSYAKDVANEVFDILLKKKKFGIYHISNSGMIDYYNFIKFLKSLLNSNSKIKPVKDSYFFSTAKKPLRNAITSNKLKKLRHWKIALKDYVKHI
jgi:dTDP-4-dehydrorhamnose reductase